MRSAWGLRLLSGAALLCIASNQDTTTPPLRIVAPSNGQLVSQKCRILLAAGSSEAIDRVELLRDGELLARSGPPYPEIMWDTQAETDGLHTLMVRQEPSGGGRGWESPSVTVTVDNTPPSAMIRAPRDGSPVNGPVKIDIQVTDAHGIALVKLLIDGQEQAVVRRSPFSISWDSTSRSNGSHTLQVRAVDRAGNGANSAPVAVTVFNRNHPPVLRLIGNQVVKEGQPLSLKLEAGDPDGLRDPLTFRAAELPPWAAFDPDTKEVSGLPDYQVAGHEQPMVVYRGVRFEVCDPQPLCDAEEISVTVQDANSPPVVDAIKEQTVAEGERVAIAVIARDPEGEPLKCTAHGLPPWLKFDAAQCSASGTPGAEVATLEDPKKTFTNLRFEVCDPASACTTKSTTITVHDPGNRAPLLRAIGEQRVDEGRLLTFLVHAEDPDGQTPVISAESLPRGATFSVRAGRAGAFAWTPQADQSGHHEMECIATDAIDEALTSTVRVKITVRETSQAIAGIIISDEGQPLEGVTIVVSSSAEDIKRVMTDAAGHYVAADLTPGSYRIKPSYQLPQTFSTTARKLQVMVFNPNHRQVVLKDRDQREVDFVASIK